MMMEGLEQEQQQIQVGSKRKVSLCVQALYFSYAIAPASTTILLLRIFKSGC